MPRPSRQRVDQNLAEKICGYDFELFGELLLQDVAGRKLDGADPVGARIPLRCRAGEGIVVDCENPPGPEIATGDCENAGASPSIEHRPIRLEWPRDSFEETQAHRGRGVLAGAESRFGRDDKRARLIRLGRRGRLFWLPQNHEARPDAQWFGPSLPRKLLKPVSGQPLRAPAKFADERSRSSLCPANNFQQRAFTAWALNDRKRVAEPPRYPFVSDAEPTRSRVLSPDIIHDSSSPV